MAITICTITGVLRDPAGAAMPDAVFTVAQAGIHRSEDGATLPKVLSRKANGSGEVTFDLMPGRYVLTWAPGPNAQPYSSPLSVPYEDTADLADLLVARDIPQRDPVGPAQDARDEAEAARDLAQAWAEGHEPGGTGTQSAKEWAAEAEDVRQTLLDEITASAVTLAPGADASADYDPESRNIEIGVPGGEPAIYRNQSHLAALLGQISREVVRMDAYAVALRGDSDEQRLVLSAHLAALASMIGQLSRQVSGGRVALAGGSLDDPALRIGSASVYSAATDTLSVAVAGVERLRITSSGITVFGTVTEV